VHIEKSSIKVTKYWNPKLDLTRLGPQMSEWTNAKGDETRCKTLIGKELRLCFPKLHDSQDKLDNLERLGTSCCILARLGWPNCAWRRDGESITVPTCAVVRR